MKVGDLVEASYNTIRGIIVEAGTHPDANNGPAVRVKWFDGSDSIEWTKYLKVLSESR